MSTPIAIGFDMGATSTKTGVVQNGKILTRGNIIETRPYTAVAVALGLGWLLGRTHRPL